METFDYFGCKYAINDDNETVSLIDATQAKGKFFIPSEVEYNGKSYSVTGLKGREDGGKETCGPFNRRHVSYGTPMQNDDITSVTIPDSVKELCPFAFFKCFALKEVHLSKSITKIPDSCFRSAALKNIELHEGITQIDKKAFYNSGLTEITIPSSVKSIDQGAFNDGWVSPYGLRVVNILNEEGAVIIHTSAFSDRVKINYLGKKKDDKPATPKTENAKEPAKGATIDIEKLIQAALADGVVTDKERAILIKKVKEAGGDTDEFEMLLDARIYEAQQKSGKAKSEPKPAAKAEPKPAKAATPNAELKQAAEKPENAADKEGRQMWVERSSEQLVSLGEKMLNIVNSAASSKYELRYTNSYIGFGINGKPSNFAWFIPKKKEIQVNIKTNQDPDFDKTLNDKFAGKWAYKGGTYSVNLSGDIEALKAMLVNAEQQFKIKTIFL